MVGCAVFNNNYAGIYYEISGFQNPTRQDSVAIGYKNVMMPNILNGLKTIKMAEVNIVLIMNLIIVVNLMR